MDDRIPVTVSIMSIFLRARVFSTRYLSRSFLDSSAVCRSSLASWALEKTTLLNALLKQEHGRRIAVIENEVWTPHVMCP